MGDDDGTVIRVPSLGAGVRNRPATFPGADRESPDLATHILRAVAADALHAAHVTVEIHTDLSFSVTDDQERTFRLDHRGSLFTTERWAWSAAAALSTRATIEVWRDGSGLRQEHAGTEPLTEPVPYAAAPGAGTRTTFHLDAGYLGPAAAITTGLVEPARPGPGGLPAHDPGHVVVRDHRDPARPGDER